MPCLIIVWTATPVLPADFAVYKERVRTTRTWRSLLGSPRPPPTPARVYFCYHFNSRSPVKKTLLPSTTRSTARCWSSDKSSSLGGALASFLGLTFLVLLRATPPPPGATPADLVGVPFSLRPLLFGLSPSPLPPPLRPPGTVPLGPAQLPSLALTLREPSGCPRRSVPAVVPAFPTPAAACRRRCAKADGAVARIVRGWCCRDRAFGVALCAVAFEVALRRALSPSPLLLLLVELLSLVRVAQSSTSRAGSASLSMIYLAVGQRAHRAEEHTNIQEGWLHFRTMYSSVQHGREERREILKHDSSSNKAPQ